MKKRQPGKRAEPQATRPHMPGYGIPNASSAKGLLPWSWATKRLSNGHNYWLATTRPDGRPHVMPVWGLWLDEAFYFSTGRQSRKARNLRANPRCVVCPEGAAKAVIVEGVASKVRDAALLKRFSRAYKKKYGWEIDPSEGPIYAVKPRVAFGLVEDADNFSGTATRWLFDDG